MVVTLTLLLSLLSVTHPVEEKPVCRPENSSNLAYHLLQLVDSSLKTFPLLLTLSFQHFDLLGTIVNLSGDLDSYLAGFQSGLEDPRRLAWKSLVSFRSPSLAPLGKFPRCSFTFYCAIT